MMNFSAILEMNDRTHALRSEDEEAYDQAVARFLEGIDLDSSNLDVEVIHEGVSLRYPGRNQGPITYRVKSKVYLPAHPDTMWVGFQAFLHQGRLVLVTTRSGGGLEVDVVATLAA